MSEDSIEDLFAELPETMRARKAELEALQAGRLSDADRAKLEAEAETDDELAYALMLFTPFDAAEMAGVQDKISAALPAAATGPALSVVQGGAQPAPAPSPVATRGARGAWVVGGMLAAAAAVVLTFMPTAPEAPFEVRAPAATALAPDDALKLEITPRAGSADTAAVTVLAVAGESVHRARVPVAKQGAELVLDAPTKDVVGPLVGVVRVLVLADTDTDPHGRIEAKDVRQMIEKLGATNSAELIVQPPAYALAVAAEGTMRGAEDLEAATASTAVEVPGKVTFNLRPATRADGEVAVHAFVARDDAAPVPLTARVRSRRAAFLVEAPTADVMAEAKTATLYFLVGPAGQTPPSPLDAPAAPWRRTVHRLYLK